MQVARVLAKEGQRLLLHTVAELDVEPGERFVHQHNGRPRYQGPGKRHALLLAAGQNVRIISGVAFQTNAGQHMECFTLGLLSGQRLQPERYVLQNREVWEQRKILKHQTDAAFLGRHESGSDPPPRGR